MNTLAKNALVCLLYGLLCVHGLPAVAETIESIEFAESLTLDTGEQLVLNGVGVRKKWIIKVYAAGLYLPEVSRSSEEIIASPSALRIRMHFLYRKISRDKLIDELDKGFRENLADEELEALAEKISELKSMFQTVYRGDEVVLDYSPETGTNISLNGEPQGVITGAEFRAAILRVWLGDNPADESLKRGLIGPIN